MRWIEDKTIVIGLFPVDLGLCLRSRSVGPNIS